MIVRVKKPTNTTIQNKQQSYANSAKNGPIKRSMTWLRLTKDLQQYEQAQKNIPNVSISFPVQGKIDIIDINIIPENPSPYFYKGTKIPFRLIFPQNSYPMEPPKLRCLATVYHPNISVSKSKVKQQQGEQNQYLEGGWPVCLPLIRQDWKPTNSLLHILFGLVFILNNPDGQDALNVQCGTMIQKNFEMYRKIVEYTLQGRTFENVTYSKLTKS